MILPESGVFLIDDDERFRQLLSQILNEYGLHTAEAGNGKQALERLHHMAPPPSLPSCSICRCRLWMVGDFYMRESRTAS